MSVFVYSCPIGKCLTSLLPADSQSLLEEGGEEEEIDVLNQHQQHIQVSFECPFAFLLESITLQNLPASSQVQVSSVSGKRILNDEFQSFSQDLGPNRQKNRDAPSRFQAYGVARYFR